MRIDTLLLHSWGRVTWAKDALRGYCPIRGKNKGFTTQGIPITQTIRRYPLDTFWEMVPNVEDTPRGQDQDVGKTKTLGEDQDFHQEQDQSSGKTKR